MSFSSLYKFALRLKGRGFSLSPKEVEFLKKLLLEFDEKFIKDTLKRCFEEVIPPTERERSSLLRCKKLFETPQKGNVYYNPKSAEGDIFRLIRQLEPQKRELLKKELEEYKRLRGNLSKEELLGYIKVLLRKYL